MNRATFVILILISTPLAFAGGSLAFTDCLIRLNQDGGLSTSEAAHYCSKGKSVEFSDCLIRLNQDGGLSTSEAARYCLKGKSVEFSDCLIRLNQDGGLSTSEAADACLVAIAQARRHTNSAKR